LLYAAWGKCATTHINKIQILLVISKYTPWFVHNDALHRVQIGTNNIKNRIRDENIYCIYEYNACDPRNTAD